MNIDYSNKTDRLQYVDTELINQTNRCILGRLNQETLGVTFRIDYNITPEISLQYYGSPFATQGTYDEFKVVTKPGDQNFNNRFSIIKNPLLVNGSVYQIDKNIDNLADYSFKKPDFNFNQFRSNMVFRWEYRPGSQIFLVWSSDRTDFLNPGNEPLHSAAGRLTNTVPTNFFLIKFNYWFSI